MSRQEKAPPGVGRAGQLGALRERESCFNGRGPLEPTQENLFVRGYGSAPADVVRAMDPDFDGKTYNPNLDRVRLGRQMSGVLRAMNDGGWWTLAHLAEIAGGSEAGISARVRDLRKMGHTVERERVAGANGLWRYRLVREVAP